MRLKDDYIELMHRHNKAKKEAAEKISNALNKAIKEFKEETGLVLTRITIDLHEHFSSRGGASDVDSSVVIDVSVKSNIDGGYNENH